MRAFDYDVATGTLGAPRVFAQWHGETDRPDGGASTARAITGARSTAAARWCSCRRAASSLAEYPLPAMCPTMCAFGGPDLRTLYVTTARQQRDADELARLPQSGGIFAMRVDVAGHCPSPLFAG